MKLCFDVPEKDCSLVRWLVQRVLENKDIARVVVRDGRAEVVGPLANLILTIDMNDCSDEQNMRDLLAYFEIDCADLNGEELADKFEALLSPFTETL